MNLIQNKTEITLLCVCVCVRASVCLRACPQQHHSAVRLQHPKNITKPSLAPCTPLGGSLLGFM